MIAGDQRHRRMDGPEGRDVIRLDRVKVNPLWAEGRRHERDTIGSEGRTPMRMRLSLREGCQRAFDEKLDRSGLFRMMSSNGLAQGGMRF